MITKAIWFLYLELQLTSKNNICLLPFLIIKMSMVVQYLNELFDHFNNLNNIIAINV
jgi:hypothetical protein